MRLDLTPQERQAILSFPTKNLQAFMAYCKGLESEDARQFSRAAESYRQAAQLDPQFGLARQKAESAETLGLSVSREAALAASARIERSENSSAPIGMPDLITARLQNLSNSLNANFVPGTENRKPTEILGERIPAPPAPPPVRP